MNRILLSLFVPIWLFAAASSTPEERARVVSIAKALEADPASPSLRSDREWALKFLIQAPDVHVTISGCATDFFLKKKRKYTSDLMMLTTIEGGRFDIEHPNSTEAEQAKAMIEGTLKGYEALVKNDSKAQFKEADEMLAKRDAGQLDEFVKGTCSGGSK